MPIVPAPKNQITIVEDALLEAMKNSDVYALDRLLHKELLFSIPNGQLITKETDLNAYKSGSMSLSHLRWYDREIQLIGNTATVTSILEMKGMYFDHPLDGTYRSLRVWKSFQGTWKVIAGSSILLQETDF